MQVSNSGLETVIKVKHFQVKKAQRELAEIKINLEKEQGALDHLEETKDSAMTDAVRIMRTRAGDLQTSRAFIQSLSRQIQQQEDRLDEIKQQEDDKRGELLEKTKSRQMVEKLDQKRKDEAEKEDERKAQKMIDVLAQRLKMGF
jgi:flagellar export protein FliJ